MKINESNDHKNIQFSKSVIHYGKEGVKTTKSFLDPFQEEQSREEGVMGTPLPFLNQREKKQWNDLPQFQKEHMMEQGKVLGEVEAHKEQKIFFRNQSGENLSKQKNLFVLWNQEKRDRQQAMKYKDGISSYAPIDFSRETSDRMLEKVQEQSLERKAKEASLKTGSVVAGKGGIAVSGAEAGGTGAAAASNPGTLAVAAGKKTADTFREFLVREEAGKEQVLHSMVKDSGGSLNPTSGVLGKGLSGVAGSIATFFALAVNTIVSLATTTIASIIAILLPIVLIISIICLLIPIFGATTNIKKPAGHGMPGYITEEMMEGFFETQKSDGIPVSTGIAQVIQESGNGSYGPGGENGKGLSRLAYHHKNLFGIKYFSGDSYAIGSVSFTTGEQSSNGANYQIQAGFSEYPSYMACIKQRAWMLAREPYASHLTDCRNQNDGKYDKEDAKRFMAGIRAAGWATDQAYVDRCVSLMDNYNLYRFDNMTFEEFQSGAKALNEEGFQSLIAEAEKHLGKAYVFGASGPANFDCSSFVCWVFTHSGISNMPRTTAYQIYTNYCEPISDEDAVAGDIIFFKDTYDAGEPISHIGIYVGDGKMIHAGDPIQYADINTPYWKQHFYGFGRAK